MPVTMSRMARKQPGEQPKKPNRTPAIVIYARINPALGEAFKQYVQGLRPKTTEGSVVEMLIEEHLKKQGIEVPSQETPPG